MTYDNVRYRGYVYINPSKIKVMRPGVSEEGLGVDNVYYDNIIHICVYEAGRVFMPKISPSRCSRGWFRMISCNGLYCRIWILWVSIRKGIIIRPRCAYLTARLVICQYHCRQGWRTCIRVGKVVVAMSFFYFAITIWSLSCSIENTLKNPSKASACSQMPCPSVFRLKDWAWEFFSRRLESFSRIGILPILGELVFLKDIFRLKHFTMHILQPECRWAGRLWSG